MHLFVFLFVKNSDILLLINEVYHIAYMVITSEVNDKCSQLLCSISRQCNSGSFQYFFSQIFKLRLSLLS